MSTDITGPLPAFIPGQIIIRDDGKTTSHQLFELPGNREAMVAVHAGEQKPAEQRQAEMDAFLLSVNPASLTDGLERDIDRYEAMLDDITGYDAQGNPLYRLTGRARSNAEMALANRRNALPQAQRRRELAERMQAEAKVAKQAAERRIAERAAVRAQELAEEAEVERRAKLIAARLVSD